MRSRERDEPGADYCLDRGLVGIGPGQGPKAERMRAAFAAVPEGTTVWTREPGGAFRRGTIAGPCREDAGAAEAVGLPYVRPAEWVERGFAEDEVPAGVAASFARGGRNFQRIRQVTG